MHALDIRADLPGGIHGCKAYTVNVSSSSLCIYKDWAGIVKA